MSFLTQAKGMVAATPILGSGAKRAYRISQRYRLARSYYVTQINEARRWALARTEDTNFYYHVTARNRATLASTVAAVGAVSVDVAEDYLTEICDDHRLRSHIESSLRANANQGELVGGLGRRIGWYAFIRLLKPKVVVETGVAHGVGACVIAAAILRNRSEGYEGYYIGTELDPQAGSLFVGPYSSAGEIRVGDSIETLKKLDTSVEIFINDSDHSAEYEAREYEVVAPLLSLNSLVLGDNCHATTALRDFAKREGRPYLFFKEEPAGHWYPGAGIGISPSSLPLPVIGVAGASDGQDLAPLG
jgi:hypothetical protein